MDNNKFTDLEIQSLNIEELDVEELEHRLELASLLPNLIQKAAVCQILVEHDWLGGAK
jgi:hypothetical protein